MSGQPRRWRLWALRGGFALALGLTSLFGVRLAINLVFWSDPTHTDQALEGWMPLGYVSQSWGVPRELLVEAARLPEGSRPRRTLAEIAQARGVPLSVLLDEVEAAITNWRALPHE